MAFGGIGQRKQPRWHRSDPLGGESLSGATCPAVVTMDALGSENTDPVYMLITMSALFEVTDAQPGRGGFVRHGPARYVRPGGPVDNAR
jgi:hypothetical protein